MIRSARPAVVVPALALALAVTLTGCTAIGTSAVGTSAVGTSAVGSSAVGNTAGGTSTARSTTTDAGPSSRRSSSSAAGSTATPGTSPRPPSPGTLSSLATGSTPSPAIATPPLPSTIGDSSGKLDASTTRWFDAFCSGFAPVLSLNTAADKLSNDLSDPTAENAFVTLLTTLGPRMTTTSTNLSVMAAPTFTGGHEYAARVVAALAAVGPAFTAGAAALKGVDIAKNPSALTDALRGLTPAITNAMSLVQDLKNLNVNPGTQAAIEAIPSCGTVKAAGA